MSRREQSDNSAEARRAEEWMQRALAVAAGSRPHPNPRVGAVAVDPDGKIVAERAHAGPGREHAEAAALAAANDRIRGGTMVVTLEPCVHVGRTPPCVHGLIAAGVKRVIVGATDPDARVAGKGIAELRTAGIEVLTGVLAEQVEEADPAYFHNRRTGRALVTLKVAATIDGQVAAADGTSKWITSPEAREDAHRLRAQADAVVVGAGTLRADDPRLSVRLEDYGGAQPIPVVVAGRKPLPVSARIYDRNPILFAPEAHPDLPVADPVIAWSPDGVDLSAMLKALAGRGLLNLLVEGGPTLSAALLRAGLVDRLVLYLGARVGGGRGLAMFADTFSTLGASQPVEIREVRKIGPDVRIDASLNGAGT